MTLASFAPDPAAGMVLNRQLAERVHGSYRDVVLSGSLYAVPPGHRVAAAQLLASHGLWIHADVFEDVRAGVSLDLIRELADKGASPIDVHLLTAGAIGALSSVCRPGIARVTFPFEGVPNPEEVAACIRGTDVAPWLAIAPGTGLEECRDALVHVDGLLVMLVKPGTRDRADMAMLRKVEAASPERAVGADGGVREAIVNDVLAAGATYVVIGRRLFESSRVPRARRPR